MNDFTDETQSKAAKTLDAIFPGLVNSLERIDLHVAELSDDELRCATFQLRRVDESAGQRWAAEVIKAALAKQLARHLARTAVLFDLNLRQSDDGNWFVELWAPGGNISHTTYKTRAEAKAAADALNAFLNLRGECEYSYQFERKAPLESPDSDDIPF